MSVPISSRLFLDYLQCRYKVYLKLSGTTGVKHDFEKFQDKKLITYQARAREYLLKRNQIFESPDSISQFKDIRKYKPIVAASVSIVNEKYALLIDAVEISSSQSSTEKAIYQPLIFLPDHNITKHYKLLLAFYGMALSVEQKEVPTCGKIISGYQFSSSKTQLISLIKEVDKIEKEIIKMMNLLEAPGLRLNDHCKICEFQGYCHAIAKEKDDLSLLKGLSRKEINTLNRRGIFTVTQYSYTFRPRRARKLLANKIIKHHHSLNALAIRTQTIYIAGKVELPSAKTRIFLDVEGIPDEQFYYLIGLLIAEGENITTHSLWANNKADETIIWKSFLEIVRTFDDYVLFHYGSYETRFLKHMSTLYGGDIELLEKIRSRSFNVLSAIYGHIYFPTYSNDLKSIASLLSFKWSEQNSSGLTSILWRKRWEENADETWKEKVVAYNNDDCVALQIVESGLRSFLLNEYACKTYPVKLTDDLKTEKPLGIFKHNQFIYPELEQINKRAYFDYQRSKIFLRTSSEVKKAVVKKRMKKVRYKINEEISVDMPNRCPLCNKNSLSKYDKQSRIVYDLKLFKYGIKRWVIKYISQRCQCNNCNKIFYTPQHRKILPTKSKYGHNLFSFIIYRNIGRLMSQNAIVEDLEDTFGYRFSGDIVSNMKAIAALKYQITYDKLLSNIINGNLIHIDETKVSIKGVNNYVWAITSMENVAYLYSSTRESNMIKEKLRDFHGVLISDFYTAYDSVACPQQKCLIHLIRDMNEDILKNPFDDELQGITKEFTFILSTIVETIDKFGLKQYHFKKCKLPVDVFLKKVQKEEYTSDLARNYQRRFVKYGDKMFTFLNYDGVPWNNNNAEHAIKRFAQLRKAIGGSSTAKGIQEYLVLLSICETLRLRNASFLKFLTSGITNVDEFLKLQRKKECTVH